jgi:tetratricopeptide (TPR) repeat protein
MAGPPAFDLTAAHRYFSADCFNKAWDFIDKVGRTAEEDEEMIRLSQAALWHWTRREDCKRANLSIGYWQLSRVYALVGKAEEARHYGRVCLEQSQGESAFLLAYAYEALARAEKVAGRTVESARYLAEAMRLAENIADLKERELLLTDLKTVS